MLHIADAGGNNLRIEIVLAENLNHVFYQCHAVFSNVVQTADKRAYIGCTGTRCHKCLRQAEHQSYIGFNAFLGKNFNCF